MFVLPINRDVRPTRTPVAVMTITAVNCAIFAAMFLFGDQRALTAQFGFVPAHITALTLFTSMFVHAGFWHIFGNMWFFWMFGPQVEDRLGSIWFTLFYLVCGLGAAVVHTLTNLHSFIPCVGASGAISGVAGLFLILFPRAPFEVLFYLGWLKIWEWQTNTKSAVTAWIAEQSILGLLSSAVRFSSVAFWAHVGGFAVGAIVGVVFSALVKRGALEFQPEYTTEGEPDPYASEQTGITELKL